MPATKKPAAGPDVPQTPTERDRAAATHRESVPHATGPTVDLGLTPGVVTIDPDSDDGRAAAASRKANGAKVTTHDNGVAEVTDVA